MHVCWLHLTWHLTISQGDVLWKISIENVQCKYVCRCAMCICVRSKYAKWVIKFVWNLVCDSITQGYNHAVRVCNTIFPSWLSTFVCETCDIELWISFIHLPGTCTRHFEFFHHMPCYVTTLPWVNVTSHALNVMFMLTNENGLWTS